MISAVSVHFLSRGICSHIDGMIAPLPDEAAAGSVMLLHRLEIILQISGAVSHGMAVFAHHVGFCAVLIKILMQAFKRRIHTAVGIQGAVIILPSSGHVPRTLIMCETIRIKFLCPLERRLKGAAIGTLISHGPHNHTGAVLIPLHTALGSVHRSLRKFRVVRNRHSPSPAP